MNKKNLTKVKLAQSHRTVLIDNCRLVYFNNIDKDLMYCINHDEVRDSNHVYLTKDNLLGCLECDREYAIAKKKGLI